MANREKLKVAIAGACGKMGQALLRAAQRFPEIQIVGALERSGHPLCGRDAGQIAGLDSLGVPLEDMAEKALAEAQVMIDFTAPRATLEHLAAAQKLKKKMVIGTTGFEAGQMEIIRRFAKKQACVLSSNFSVGVNLLWKAIAQVAEITGDDYDVEIVEAHHHFKKDSPSGTALTTAKVLAEALGRSFEQSVKYGRGKEMGERKPREIGIHAVRGGDIVGDHTVLFAGPGERLEFKHQAHSRENFASGGLRAALWLRAKKSGLFSMRDVLGL